MSDPGLVIIEGDNPNPGDTTVFLANFQTSHTELKVEHQMALLDVIPDLIMGPIRPPTVHITGTASRRGSTSFNQGLSEGRATEVFNFLVSSGVPRSRIRRFDPPIGVGESRASGDENANFDMDRSVIIVISPNPLPPIRLPRPRRRPEREHFQPTGKPISSTFAIQMKMGVGGTLGPTPVAVEFLIFVIWDVLHMVASKYDYLGRGIGRGFPPNPFGARARVTSLWSQLRTRRDVPVDHFSGDAEFRTLSFGSGSGASLILRPFDRSLTVPTVSFRLGSSIGLPEIISGRETAGKMLVNGGIVRFIGVDS